MHIYYVTSNRSYVILNPSPICLGVRKNDLKFWRKEIYKDRDGKKENQTRECKEGEIRHPETRGLVPVTQGHTDAP